MITERPIPGQSLTTPPQSQPYERPPQITDAVDALDYHIDRLNRKESKEDIIDLIELEIIFCSLKGGNGTFIRFIASKLKLGCAPIDTAFFN